MKRGIRYVDGETLPGDPAYPGGAGNGVGAGSDGKSGCIGGNDPARSKPAGPDGKLKKIYGGAASLETGYQTREIRVEERQELYVEEKKQIAKYAASLIEPGDFVYVDAGSSTEYLVEYIEERDASYVTNSMSHALKLAGRGMKVSILGGNVKGTTEAVVGADAMETLRRYHFTRGFWGSGRNPQEGGLYHAGDGRSSGETAVHETDQGMLCAL